MSLPNNPPSRNKGSHLPTKRDAPPMNVCVQWASTGSPEIAAATSAATGATTSTLQPRKASHINRASASNIPRSPMVLPSITKSAGATATKSLDMPPGKLSFDRIWSSRIAQPPRASVVPNAVQENPFPTGSVSAGVENQ